MRIESILYKTLCLTGFFFLSPLAATAQDYGDIHDEVEQDIREIEAEIKADMDEMNREIDMMHGDMLRRHNPARKTTVSVSVPIPTVSVTVDSHEHAHTEIHENIVEAREYDHGPVYVQPATVYTPPPVYETEPVYAQPEPAYVQPEHVNTYDEEVDDTEDFNAPLPNFELPNFELPKMFSFGLKATAFTSSNTQMEQNVLWKNPTVGGGGAYFRVLPLEHLGFDASFDILYASESSLSYLKFPISLSIMGVIFPRKSSFNIYGVAGLGLMITNVTQEDSSSIFPIDLATYTQFMGTLGGGLMFRFAVFEVFAEVKYAILNSRPAADSKLNIGGTKEVSLIDTISKVEHGVQISVGGGFCF